MENKSGKIIGIDLGTTNSCVAVWEGGSVTVIENLEGRRITPSVVSFTPNGRKIGDTAKRQAARYPEMTISSVKRLMGENFSAVKDILPQFPYHVVKGRNGRAAIDLENTQLLPQQISAYILIYLKECAKRYLGTDVTEAVITVPAYFEEPQRQATKEAARIAGLNVRRIVNEPTAAALAFSYTGMKLGRILVFDLGGGTFDISVLNCYENIYDVFGTGGDTHLGGDDIDTALYNRLLEDFLSGCRPGYQLAPDQKIRLREAAEEAKINLSTSTSTEISLTWLAPDAKGNEHLIRTVTRDMLEELAAPIVSRCREKCEETVRDSELLLDEIDHVLMVGGSSKIPCVRAMVEDYFGRKPSFIQDADQCVAIGAAIEGAIINGEIDRMQLLDVTPLALGVMTTGRVFDVIIEPNTTIPTSRTIRYEAKDGAQKGVSIIVVQGRNAYDTRRKRIGDFDIMGIQAGPNGVAEVDVTFDIDQNGLLTVSARDVVSGQNGQTRIENANQLSDAEIDHMKEELALDSGQGLSLMEIVKKSRPAGQEVNNDKTEDYGL